MTFLTQHLGSSIFDPNLGSNNPALFRLYNIVEIINMLYYYTLKNAGLF